MPSLREAIHAIYGCWQLLWMNPKGLQRLDASPEGAMRSFTVALYLVPTYYVLVLMRFDAELDVFSLSNLIAVHAPAYVLAWTAYPLLMYWVTKRMDCAPRFPLFVTAHNWASLLLTPIYVPVMVLVESSLLSVDVAESFGFVITLFILTCWWIITHLTLELPPLVTTGLVIINLIVSEFISAVADALLRL